MPNIVLVGPMGVGKTYIGKRLARKLNWPFYDSDAEIMRRTGVTIVDIFDIEGEEGFRRRESDQLSELLELDHVVIATGGGIVTQAVNRQRLIKNKHKVVYLRAEPEQLYERLRYDTSRPLLQNESPLDTLRQLITIRDPLYSMVADFILDNSKHGNSKAVVPKIVKWYKTHYAALSDD